MSEHTARPQVAPVRLGSGFVPNGNAVHVIAEAGVNHNGDVAMAHQLIDIAVEAGADSVKFQTFSPEKLVSSAAATTPYQRDRGGDADQRSLLDALTLPIGAWAELRDHATQSGIDFLSTPFDIDSAEMLVDLGLTALKVSSGELTNLPYLRELSRLGVSVLVSTGMGSEDEVAAAVEACAEAPGMILFHCVSAYPAPLDECNLRAIPAMAARFGVPVGWSDHTTGLTSALGAVALGAPILEKHFTIDSTLPGPDHLASLEPEALAEYVTQTKALATALGDGAKRRMPSEQDNAPLVRRSWHAAHDLMAGVTLDGNDLRLLRPEGGISPAVDLRGRTVRRDIAAGERIIEADLDPTSE